MNRYTPEQIADYAIRLHRRNSECLGFLPSQKMLHYARQNQILLSSDGGEVCGYLILGNGSPISRIYQACVEYDLRRSAHGASLVDKALWQTNKNGNYAVELRCRENLEANVFWRVMGFSLVRRIAGGQRRGRMLNVWRQELRAPRQMVLV